MKEPQSMSEFQKNYFLDFFLYNATVGYLGNDRNLQQIGFRQIYRVNMPGSLLEQNSVSLALSFISLAFIAVITLF